MMWVWEHSKAEGVDRLVMLALADYAGDNGWCFPRQETLAVKCLVSLRTVQRSLEALVSLGEIEVQRRARLNWYKVIGDNVTSNDNAVAFPTRQADVLDTSRCHVEHVNVTSPKNQSVNQSKNLTRDASLNKPQDRRWVEPPNFVRDLDQLPEKTVEPMPSTSLRDNIRRLRRPDVDS